MIKKKTGKKEKGLKSERKRTSPPRVKRKEFEKTEYARATTSPAIK